VNQVPAVKDRKSRKVFKGGRDKVIIFANPANGRIRVTALKDRVAKRFLHSRELSFDRARGKTRDDLPLSQ
jgi:hypothetical protein